MQKGNHAPKSHPPTEFPWRTDFYLWLIGENPDMDAAGRLLSAYNDQCQACLQHWANETIKVPLAVTHLLGCSYVWVRRQTGLGYADLTGGPEPLYRDAAAGLIKLMEDEHISALVAAAKTAPPPVLVDVLDDALAGIGVPREAAWTSTPAATPPPWVAAMEAERRRPAPADLAAVVEAFPAPRVGELDDENGPDDDGPGGGGGKDEGDRPRRRRPWGPRALWGRLVHAWRHPGPLTPPAWVLQGRTGPAAPAPAPAAGVPTAPAPAPAPAAGVPTAPAPPLVPTGPTRPDGDDDVDGLALGLVHEDRPGPADPGSRHEVTSENANTDPPVEVPEPVPLPPLDGRVTLEDVRRRVDGDEVPADWTAAGTVKGRVRALLWDHAGDTAAVRAAWRDHYGQAPPSDVYRYARTWVLEVLEVLALHSGDEAPLDALGRLVPRRTDAMDKAAQKWAASRSNVTPLRRTDRAG